MRYEDEWREVLEIAADRTDYETLLAEGEVLARTDTPDDWRAEIRRHARQDRIRVQTVFKEPDLVFARLLRRSGDEREMLDWMGLVVAAHDRARQLGHETHALASIHKGTSRRQAAECRRCNAPMFIQSDPPLRRLADGDALTERCRR